MQVRSALNSNLTLASAVAPRIVPGGLSDIWRQALLVVAFSVLVAASAQIAIPLPFTPVPLTAQTLVVLLTGAVLGARLGGLALLTYCAEGLAGLPVFAGGLNAWSPSALGVPWVLGPTAGYVIGFLFAAILVGWLAERRWDRSVLLTACAMVLGNLVIYAFGVGNLTRFVPFPAVLTAGLVPFLTGDAIKIVIASIALPGAWALVGKPRR